jgi:hypothetical protein
MEVKTDEFILTPDNIETLKNHSESKVNETQRRINIEDAKAIFLPLFENSPVEYGTLQIKTAEYNELATKKQDSCLIRLTLRCCNGRTKTSCPAQFIACTVNVEKDGTAKLSVYETMDEHNCFLKDKERSIIQAPERPGKRKQKQEINNKIIKSKRQKSRQDSNLDTNESRDYEQFLLNYNDLKSWIDSMIIKVSSSELAKSTAATEALSTQNHVSLLILLT